MDAAIDWKAEHIPPFTVGEWLVDAGMYRISRGEAAVKLEPKVMEALVYLASHAGQTVTREELENNVWAGTVVGYYSLTGTMQKLRKAFDDDPKNPRIIETLSKKGYRLIADINLATENPARQSQLYTQSANQQSAFHPSTSANAMLAPASNQRFIAIVALLVLAVAGTLYFNYGTDTGRAPVVKPVSTQQSIAVLPFENHSDDKSNDYFVDGITNDIITDLTKIAGLIVIARDSTFEYKGGDVDIQDVAKKLKTRYVLHGNMRRADNKVRINAFLVDAETNKQLWAERYDGEVQNIFALQDQLSTKIVSALKVKLTTQESKNISYKYTNNIAAYEVFLKGRETAFLYSKQDTNKAQQLLQQAIELDPTFGEAYALLGWTYAYSMMNGWGNDRGALQSKALELADKALTLHEQIPTAYFVRGLVYRDQKQYNQALVEAEKAIAIDPNYANGHVLVATLLYYEGRAEEGLERMKFAARINPHHPHNYPFHMGQAYFVLKRYDEAIQALEKGLESRPRSERIHIWLAAAYAQAGKIDDAKWEAEQILQMDPEFSYARIQEVFPFKEPADLQRFLDGLRKAGLSV